MNQPYVVHTVGGVPINPITKGDPIVTKFPNRKARRAKASRPFSNKSGIQVVVAQIGSLSFLKYHRKPQVIANSRGIGQLILKN